MFEGVGYHNQLKYVLYTTNPGPTLHLPDYIEHVYIKIKRGFPPCFHGLHVGWCHETGLSPPVKYFYWPFQGGTSFVDHLHFFSVLCLLCFHASVY